MNLKQYELLVLFLEFKEKLLDIRSISSLTPLPNKPLLTVSDGGKLTCNFDDEMEYCGWHNAENTEMKFWKGKLDPENSFDSERFTAGSSLLFSTDNNFLLAGGEPMVFSKTAAIEMEIPCQYGDADIKFDFWTNTLNVDVRYCIAKVSEDFNNCSILQRVSNPLYFSVPTTADGLKVRIEVTNIDADSITLLDNLHYNGQICELIDEATEHSFVEFNGESSSFPSLITGQPLSSTDPNVVQKFFEDSENNIDDKETSSDFSIQIFFVADNVKKHQFLALDNIRVESIDGSILC
uniref:MAM domain-containing protein n=1 Tax=Caenorhabditis tropicalis TaxID=1561998 RepID=A0A1I7T1C1_9PELO